MYVIGDLNARIHRAFRDGNDYFGPYIYGDPDWRPRSESIAAANEDLIQTNRVFLKQFCHQHGYIVKNTFLKKRPAKQVTYADPTQPNKMAPPIDHTTGRVSRDPGGNYHFAQLDLVLVHKRWAQSVTDVESRRGDFVYWTRHFPIHIDIKLRLKAKAKMHGTKPHDASVLLNNENESDRIKAKEAMLSTLHACRSAHSEAHPETVESK